MSSEGPGKTLVVGAGVMGSSIAQVFAAAGSAVALVDVKEQVLVRALSQIENALNTLAEFGEISGDAIPSILARITTSDDMEKAAADADFVIEAVPEVIEIKAAVFSQLDRFCPPDTIIASNTSGLDVFSLADVKRPERMMITHFFAPAHIIPLVEVVPGSGTSPQVIERTVRFLQTAGKNPVVLKAFVRSFIVNRIQNAIGSAVIEILENDWATPEDIDRAVKLSLGIRLPILGAVQTADFNGLDLICDILKSFGRESTFFGALVEQGRLGVKTSKGIYDYGGRSEAEILKKRDRLLLSMLEHLKKINAFEPV